MKYYEDFSVGDIQRSDKTYQITEQEIVEFGTRWDSQSFHVDAEAAKESAFGGLVASSCHLFAVAIGLWNNPDLPAEQRTAAISALGFDRVKLRAPARPGDRLNATAQLIEKRESASRPEAGIMVFHNQVRNERDELVFEYESAALYARRNAGEVI